MNTAEKFIAEMAEQISMPDVYIQIRQLFDQKKFTLKDYIKVIEKDSMLTTRLIRIANSHYFGYPERVNDLNQAIILIGVMQLHDLMLTNLSLRTFASIPQQIFNLEEFWRYSIQCGIAARTIAQYSQIFPINPYFSLGLLHEIGHAAMYFKKPEQSLQAVEQSQQENSCLTKIEDETLGFDYTQAGTALMHLWHLPDIYQQTTTHHLHPELADKAHQQTVKIIHLAHIFCQEQQLNKHRSLFKEISESDHKLNKLPSNIDEIIIKEINTNTNDILNMLWPDSIQQLSSKAVK
ncbi:MAG: HDOD domain-containing protein [Gammaproteobacteria bacterium]|nr:HDOD domain-containing protein [Gammaproteobacteria bacterium]